MGRERQLSVESADNDAAQAAQAEAIQRIETWAPIPIVFYFEVTIRSTGLEGVVGIGLAREMTDRRRQRQQRRRQQGMLAKT
jgi:hypothetical protein